MPEPTAAPAVLSLGHAVLRVSDLKRSLTFYRDILGLREVARRRNLVFLSGGERHHDLALMEVHGHGPALAGHPPTLHHLAFRIGNCLDALRAMRERLDGLLIELYVDADPAIWRENPAAVAYVGPLEL